MSEIIAFEIYRSEEISINGETFRVNFSKRKDAEEYALFAVSSDRTKSWRGFYSAETAADFERSHGETLEKEMYAVLRGDIESGNYQSSADA